ncbi:MAG: class I SAM-dependent methyltransferase [bacterium]
MTKNKFHHVKWDNKKIKSFWDNLSSDNSLQNLYFSKQRGKSLLRFVKKHIAIKGRVVDLGCGPGYFIDHLLNADIACTGADISPGCIEKLNQRLANNNLFTEALVNQRLLQVPFKNESIDVIFSIETIEHSLPGDITQYLMNIHNSLVKGGYLIVTVPYRENLKKSQVICPDCLCAFHNTQHINTYTTVTLKELLQNNGFSTVVCKPVILLPEWKIYFSSINSISMNYLFNCPECGLSFQYPVSFLKYVLNRINPSNIFHLVYVGQKR